MGTKLKSVNTEVFSDSNVELGGIDPNVIVPVTTGVQQVPQGAGILALNGLTTNPLIPTSTPVVQFTDSDSVGQYFGITSNEYLQSLIYFKGTDQSAIVPPYIYFSKYINVATAPYIRSQTIANTTTALANIVKLKSTNTFTFYNGTSLITATNVVLGTLSSLSAVASALQTAIQSTLSTATVTWDGTLNQFSLSNGVVASAGTPSTLSFDPAQAVTNLNDLMGLSSATNAYLSQGSVALTPAQNLDNIVDYVLDTANFYPVDNLGDATTTTFLGLAQWISTVGNNRYGLFLFDASPAETQSPDTTSLQALITSNLYANTSVFYNNVNLCVVAGTVFASSDYTQPRSAVTACFKSQAGIIPTVSSTTVAKVLLAKGTNFYGLYGLATATYAFLQAGSISGSYKFIDNLIASIWIERNIQLALFNLFTAVNEVVNDNVGYGQIKDQITTVLNANITNGVIALNVDLSAYKQEILSKYGVDVTILSNAGFYIIATPATAQQRQIRVTPQWIILYVKGNAIQELPITITQLN